MAGSIKDCGIDTIYVVKQLNLTLADDEFSKLKEVKNGRTWREAILDEFGVDA